MMKYEGLTEQIIKAFYTVYNSLGYGFLEKVYERALAIELDKMGYWLLANTPSMFTMMVKWWVNFLPIYW